MIESEIKNLMKSIDAVLDGSPSAGLTKEDRVLRREKAASKKRWKRDLPPEEWERRFKMIVDRETLGLLEVRSMTGTSMSDLASRGGQRRNGNPLRCER